MKRHLGVSAVSLLFIGASIIPIVASASEMRVGDQPNVASSENIPGNLYIAGGNVTSAGQVGGDVIAAGGNILIGSLVSNCSRSARW